MKLFSRKALVAGAAAVALSFAGTSVAAAEEGITSEALGAPEEGQNPVDEPGDEPVDEPGDDEKDKDEDNGLSSQDPKDISAWISVFTAVIGALGALFAFASKYLGFKL